MKNSLKKQELNKVLGVKVSAEFHAEVLELCFKKDWSVSKFIRQAIQESMDKVNKK